MPARCLSVRRYCNYLVTHLLSYLVTTRSSYLVTHVVTYVVAYVVTYVVTYLLGHLLVTDFLRAGIRAFRERQPLDDRAMHLYRDVELVAVCCLLTH